MATKNGGGSATGITRRAFTAMASAALVTRAAAQASGIRLRKLHCCEIRVDDVERSTEFYQQLFGLPVLSRSGDRVCLGIGSGPQFMAIRRVSGDEPPRIAHLGYSVADFNAGGVIATLRQSGFELIDAPPLTAVGIDYASKCWVNPVAGIDTVFFADPRGLIVELSSDAYCGGARCELEDSSPGMLELDDINHFTVFLNDGAGANLFYQTMFDLSVQAWQGPQGPVTGIGDGYQFVMYAGPARPEPGPANIHHGCFSMPGFDVENVLATLTRMGLSARGDRETGPLMHYVSLRMPERGGAEGGTPELYFTDPDGILMQLQDVSYCGGGGYLGEECVLG